MTTKPSLADVCGWMVELEDYETKWNDWERNFLTDMNDKLETMDKKLELSEVQVNKIRQIRDKYIK